MRLDKEGERERERGRTDLAVEGCAVEVDELDYDGREERHACRERRARVSSRTRRRRRAEREGRTSCAASIVFRGERVCEGLDELDEAVVAVDDACTERVGVSERDREMRTRTRGRTMSELERDWRLGEAGRVESSVVGDCSGQLWRICHGR